MVNDKDINRNSILHLAVKYNNIEIIKKLIPLFDSNNKALIELVKDKNKDGDSFLHLAMKNNNEIIKRLIPLFDGNNNGLFELIKDKNQDGHDETNATETIVKNQIFQDQQVHEMKSLFEGDISRFIGTPLQLHLLLGAKTFIESFVQWTYNTKQSFNFDYIGIDM
ncbi:hypothetical protein BLOT_012330 [Blomia tropicalis]|nr:hypothetical protein BLOT_012330 [Blomia tropicalis]